MSESSTSLALVCQLFDPGANWKEIGLALGRLPPDEPAALRVIQGFRQRHLPAWLTAFLLGQIRHRSGYDVAREILLGEHELSYESYAAVAMAMISPDTAYDDLWRIYRSSPSKRSRGHIEYGLLATSSPRLWDDLVQATTEELASINRTARLLAGCTHTVDQLLMLLRSENPRQRELGLMVVDNLRPKTQSELGLSVVVAAAKVLLSDPSLVINPARRLRLTNWLLS